MVAVVACMVVVGLFRWININKKLHLTNYANATSSCSSPSSSSSSSSLACPVIWGRRYSWLASSSILPCLLRCPLSTLPVSYLSYTHLYILCLAALFFFSLVCPHLAFFSLCAPLSFSSHGRTTSVVLCNFLGRLCQSCCPSNAFISDLIPPWHVAHPSQHLLIYN